MTKKDELMSTLLKKAKKLGKKPTIVLTEGWDERGLKAAEYIVKENIAEMILLGNEKDIKKAAEKSNVDISKMKIINQKTSGLRDGLAEALFRLREKKGMTKEKALELLNDVNYFGCMLAHTGKADAVVGSLICPTAELMKPALQILKAGFVNEVFLLYDPTHDRIIFATDASLNIEPTEEELADMGVNAGKTARLFGIEPKIGFLSFSTYGSGGADVPQVKKVKDAVKLAQEKAPDMQIDGEFQFDAALNPDAAKRKCPDSKLGGKCNVVVFPNLNAANIFVHGMNQFCGADFLFSMPRGMKKPVGILGRSTPAETVKNMFVLAAVEAVEGTG